jgi:hypothetical protein
VLIVDSIVFCALKCHECNLHGCSSQWVLLRFIEKVGPTENCNEELRLRFSRGVCGDGFWRRPSYWDPGEASICYGGGG